MRRIKTERREREAKRMSRESNAARAFAEKWNGRGAEKQESQLFWLELMEKVLGAEHATDMVRFEEKG